MLAMCQKSVSILLRNHCWKRDRLEAMHLLAAMMGAIEEVAVIQLQMLRQRRHYGKRVGADTIRLHSVGRGRHRATRGSLHRCCC